MFVLAGCTDIWNRARDYGMGWYQLTQEQKTTCGITVQTTEWPYYVQNTPLLADNTNLNKDNLVGKVLLLTGKVLDGLSDTGISGAKIEIRQADDQWVYHPQGNNDYSSYQPSEVKLRGHIVTDAQWNYMLQTIYPGLYEGRARHIHFRVSAGDTYNPVITQLILPFDGDMPTPENDNVAQWLPNCQIISGNKLAETYQLHFDFRLKAE